LANSWDDFAKKLNHPGAGRPVNEELDRAAVLAARESVDAAYSFPDRTAIRFLAAAQPGLYAGDNQSRGAKHR